MRANRRLLTLGSTFAAAIMISTLLAPVAGAADARLTFGTDFDGMQIGSSCVSGQGAVPEGAVRLGWRDAAGVLKDQADLTASPGSGYWSYCSEATTLAIGDVLKVSDELGSRKFTMPNVTLVADRVHDVFRGKGPANGSGAIWWHAGLFADYYDGVEFTTDSSGSWLLRPEELGDLIGGIDVELYFESPKGDFMSARGAAPYIQVTLGRSRFEGTAGGFQTVKASIRDATTGDLLGRGTAVGDNYGSYSSAFLDVDGNPVKVAAGDRLRSNIASDANWIVPNIEGSADVATDFVYGRCFDAGTSDDFASVTVYRAGGGFRGRSLPGLDETGAFEIDFSRPDSFMFNHANIKHGDRIEVECYQVTGDIVRAIIPVP